MSDKKTSKMFNKIIKSSKEKSTTSKGSGKFKKDSKTTTISIVNEGSKRAATPVVSESSKRALTSVSIRKCSKISESISEVSRAVSSPNA